MWHKITYPPDRFSKLGYSTSESLSISSRVPLERSRRQLSKNGSVGIGIVLGAEQPSLRIGPGGGVSCVIYGRTRKAKAVGLDPVVRVRVRHEVTATGHADARGRHGKDEKQ